MRHSLSVIPAIGILGIVIAACSREPDVDPQLKADLDAAKAGSIELAPAGSGTKVVSDVEQVNRTQTRSTAPKPRTQVTSEAPRRQETAPVNAPANTSSEPAATVPVSKPQVQPPPPGGYKSIGDVIRKAPFPINPATETTKTRKKP